MKKAILGAVVLMAFSASAMAADSSQAISVGYANSSIEVDGYDFPDDGYGISAKYRSEFDNSFGVIGSFTYTNLSETYNGIGLDLDYMSLTFGPTLRANQYFSVYGLIGMARGEAEALGESDSDTAFAYGAGLQIDVTKNVTLDASYEFAGFSGDLDVSTWSIGVGFRF